MDIFLSPLEKELRDIYTPTLATMTGSEREAKSAFTALLMQVKADSKREGSNNLPPNFGEVYLNRSKLETGFRELLDIKYSDGVRDEDILWWWNMHDLERRMMLKVDELFRVNAILVEQQKTGLSTGELAARVKATYPQFQEVTRDVNLPITVIVGSIALLVAHGVKGRDELNEAAKLMMSAEQWVLIIMGIYLVVSADQIRWY